MEGRWQSAEEIAKYLGFSNDAVDSWVTIKGMSGHTVGRVWKFKREDVDEWIRARGFASSSDELRHEESKKNG